MVNMLRYCFFGIKVSFFGRNPDIQILNSNPLLCPVHCLVQNTNFKSLDQQVVAAHNTPPARSSDLSPPLQSSEARQSSSSAL